MTASRLLLLLLLLVVPARAQYIISDFNSGSDGWTAYTQADHNTTVAWSASSGNGGSGGLTLVEPANGANDYFEAPSKFKGNLSAYYNGTASFDLQLNLAPAGAEAAMIILSGLDANGSPLSIGYLPASSAQYPVTSGFTSYTLNLNATTAWTVVNSSDFTTATLATNTQIESVLSNVTDFRIMGDWSSQQDRDILDNVALQGVSAAPEPSQLTLFGLAGALACFSAAWREYRRRRTG